jgi:hypothetical protein
MESPILLYIKFNINDFTCNINLFLIIFRFCIYKSSHSRIKFSWGILKKTRMLPLLGMLLVTIQLTLVFALHTARPPWPTFSMQEVNYLSQFDQYNDLARGRMTQGSTPSYVTYLSPH